MVNPDLYQTSEFKALREKQRNAREAMYAALREKDEKAAELAKVAYEATVTEIREFLGNEGPCCYVDMDKWSYYSDYHRDYYGFRPACVATCLKTPEEIDDDIQRMNTHAAQFGFPSDRL